MFFLVLLFLWCIHTFIFAAVEWRLTLLFNFFIAKYALGMSNDSEKEAFKCETYVCVCVLTASPKH